MRTLIPVAAGVVLLAAACAAPQKPARPTPPPTPTPLVENLITTPPREMVLRDEDMPPGMKPKQEGTLITAGWTKSWTRDATDPGAADGATFVTDAATIYRSNGEAVEDFAQFGMTEAVTTGYIRGSIQQRAIDPSTITVTRVQLDPLGVDGQSLWRAQFSRGAEVYVQYFGFLRRGNTQAELSIFAQSTGTTEAPRLLDEARGLMAKRAERMRALQPRPQVVPTDTPTPTPALGAATGTPAAGGVPGPTPRPN